MAGQGRSGMPLWVGAGLLLAIGVRLAVAQKWIHLGDAAEPAPTPKIVQPVLKPLQRVSQAQAAAAAMAAQDDDPSAPKKPVELQPPSVLFGLPKPAPALRLSIESGSIPVAGGKINLMPLGQFQHIVQLFGPIRDHVNAVVPLEKELVLHFKKCGEVNAFYSPVSDDITVCSELIDVFKLVFQKLPPDEQDTAVQGATLFATAHELGHALIARLKLPAVGGEEQAADQFALLLLQQRGPEGTSQAIDAAQWMIWMAQHRNPKVPLAFWDEHKLDAQRFFDMLCLAYGADPFGHVRIVSEGFLPAPRAARCGDEYQKMKAAWKVLLDPKLRRPL